MVLEYKFEYLSNNGTLIKFLEAILKKENNKDFSFEIFREENLIYLYIQGDEKKLLEVSEKLSVELPMSIFLKNYKIEVVSEIPKKEKMNKDEDFNLPYCSKCVYGVEDKKAVTYYDAFFKCDICDGLSSSQKSLNLFGNNSKKEFQNNKELFEFLALEISLNKRVKIKTKAGDFVFYKTTKLKSFDEKVLCTNINSLSKLTVTSKEKTVALLCIEKPSLDFNLNAVYRSNNKLDFEKVNVRYAYDLVLYLLSLELQKLEIDFLSYEKSDIFDYNLTYEDFETLTTPSIVINDGKTLLIENKNYDKRLDDIYNKFQDKSKSQFMVLIEENNLYEKSIINIFTSSLYDDNISLYSKKIDGVIDILNYNVPTTLNPILDEIVQEESGKKLLKNYQEKFPENFEKALTYSLNEHEKNSIYSLWSFVAVLLGFDKENEKENIILENAQKAVLQKGPRVDYKLKKSDKIFNKEFDVIKLIKSGISFKLAGVDDKTLCFGYLESYAYFLADIIDNVHSEFPLNGVSLCGDLIGNELFYKLINKAITKNFDLYYNKDFPIQL